MIPNENEADTEQPARQDTAYAELRALAEKATPGPWHIVYGDDHSHMCMTAITNDQQRTHNAGPFEDREQLVAITFHQTYPVVDCENPDDCGDANSQYIAAANPAAILTLLADNDRLTERGARAERALIRTGWHDLGGHEWKPPIGPGQDALAERVAVLEEQVTTLKNIMALQNVALESKAELQTLAEDYPHANEAAKVEFAEYREKARIAIVDLFQRMEKSYAAEPTRRITMMDLGAVFHHVKELGLGGCLDGAAPPSPAEGE